MSLYTLRRKARADVSVVVEIRHPNYYYKPLRVMFCNRV
jgi:hypothetical protein